MKKYVGEWYVHYKYYLLNFVGLSFIMMLQLVFSIIEQDTIFNVDIRIVNSVIIVCWLLNVIIRFLVRKNYEQHVFYEINRDFIKAGNTRIYTFYKIAKEAPLANVLDYEIKQGPIAKRYKVYIIKINCGSEFLKLYVEEADMRRVEARLNEILEANLEFRRYKDE